MDYRSGLQKAAAFSLGVTTPLALLFLLILSFFKFREIKELIIQDMSDRVNRYAITALTVLGLISFIFTTIPYGISFSGVFFVFLAVYIYYLLRVFDIDRLSVLRYYIIGISILAFFGIYQYIFLNGITKVMQIGFVTLNINMSAGRISSLVGNSNLLAGFMALGLIAGLALFFSIRDKTKYIYLFLSAIALVALLLTQSRGAIVAAVLAICMLMIYIERKYAYGILIGLMFLLGLIVLVAPSIPNQFIHRVLTTGAQDTSRELLWRGAMDMIKERPLTGVGPAGFNANFNKNIEKSASEINFHNKETIEYYKSVNYTDPHNTFLRLASEWGIPFALVLMLFLLYRSVMAIYKQTDITTIVAVIGIFMVMLMGLVDDPLASGEILSGFLLLNSLVHRKMEVKKTSEYLNLGL